jgi:hypothetical protein
MSLVLVVEDEVDLSHIMRDRLIADGHECRTVSCWIGCCPMWTA